jgi:2-dehydrotetronate isomerase
MTYPGFAANLSTLFPELPFPLRFAAAAAAGFTSVEIQFPYDLPASQLQDLLQSNGLKLELFNLPPGDFAAGERGLAALPGAEGRFGQALDTALGLAAALGCPRLHAMAGIGVPGSHDAFLHNIAGAATLCATQGVTLLVEPISPGTIPGYFLADFDQAAAIIAELSSPDNGPRLQFDIFHCAMIHGDVVRRIRNTAAITGHYQIAGTPDRHEPDLGTLDWRAAIAAAGDANPDLIIGCEYTPAGRTETGLGWLKAL